MQTCKTCKRSDVGEINRLVGAGKPLRYIMDKFAGISQGGIQRHKDNCLKDLFADVLEEKRAGLLADVDEVKQEIKAVAAKFSGNGSVRVQLIARRLDVIEKEAKLTGAYTKEKDNPTTVKDIAAEVIATLTQEGYAEPKIRAVLDERYSEDSDAIN